MATNNYKIIQEVIALLNSVKAELARVTGDDEITENTKHTKCYNLRREIKRLVVIHTLLKMTEEGKLQAMMDADKTFKESLLSIINPESAGVRVEVSEGDKLLDLINTKYRDVKDVVARAKKAAEKAGLTLAADNNTFVKKA